MERKTIYNPDSKESLNERRIFGGNSDGMINFTRMKYQWALNLWDTMEANTWFPREVQMTGDAKDYKFLTEPEKEWLFQVLKDWKSRPMSTLTGPVLYRISLMTKKIWRWHSSEIFRMDFLTQG